MISIGIRPFLATLLFIALTAGCTNRVGPNIPDTQKDKTMQLFLELEQRYKRSLDRNGFGLHYSIERPNTVVISMRYYEKSREEQLAFRTLTAAEKFVASLAKDKYQLDIEIKKDIKKLPKPQKRR